VIRVMMAAFRSEASNPAAGQNSDATFSIG